MLNLRFQSNSTPQTYSSAPDMNTAITVQHAEKSTVDWGKHDCAIKHYSLVKRLTAKNATLCRMWYYAWKMRVAEVLFPSVLMFHANTQDELNINNVHLYRSRGFVKKIWVCLNRRLLKQFVLESIWISQGSVTTYSNNPRNICHQTLKVTWKKQHREQSWIIWRQIQHINPVLQESAKLTERISPLSCYGIS